MTIPELQTAFLNHLPIYSHKPGQPKINYAFISEIRYWRHSITKKIEISCTLMDERCDDGSCATYLYKDVHLITHIEATKEDICIDSKLQNAFVKRKPVTVRLENGITIERKEITALIFELSDDKEIELYCLFENNYESIKRQGKYVKVKSKTERINYKAIVDLFIELCPELPKPLRLNDTRKKAIKSGMYTSKTATDSLSYLARKVIRCTF